MSKARRKLNHPEHPIDALIGSGLDEAARRRGVVHRREPGSGPSTPEAHAARKQLRKLSRISRLEREATGEEAW